MVNVAFFGLQEVEQVLEQEQGQVQVLELGQDLGLDPPVGNNFKEH